MNNDLISFIAVAVGFVIAVWIITRTDRPTPEVKSTGPKPLSDIDVRKIAEKHTRRDVEPRLDALEQYVKDYCPNRRILIHGAEHEYSFGDIEFDRVVEAVDGAIESKHKLDSVLTQPRNSVKRKERVVEALASHMNMEYGELETRTSYSRGEIESIVDTLLYEARMAIKEEDDE